MATHDIESRLNSHSAYFTSMIELIPTRFYAVKEHTIEGSDEEETDSKFWVNKRSRAPKQTVKDTTKKAKRLRFNLSENKVGGAALEEESRVKVAALGSSSTDPVEEDHGDECSSEEGSNRAEIVSKRHPKASFNGFSVERVKSGDLNDLRERLHNKIALLRGKRELYKQTEEDVQKEGGASSKVAIQKQRRTMEKRQKKKEARKKDKERKHVTRKHSTSVAERSETYTKRPSIKDESGRVVFSKFDFSTSAELSEPKSKTKDYKKLLAKAEAAEKKLEKLKETDEKKSKELQERLQWQRAMEMAKGTKLRDDTKRLKKTVKRLEGKKAKSRKQWFERQKQETLAKEKQQEKRQKNIQERIEQVKSKKLKKRGKARKPGF